MGVCKKCERETSEAELKAYNGRCEDCDVGDAPATSGGETKALRHRGTNPGSTPNGGRRGGRTPSQGYF